ncbi:hypothetical protein GCM10025881_29640 [Pseudolysinimonas kribbensis]|uniref:Uncharacterized protein n=1 Tax=Pseudolysinimonas kribbensis TaxID=433641 RepID=A0ABQ6K963_9MICO|nr:hypothetical protein GCM10025881_29640 [Pseudolysinimonas kribbensis]
MRQLENRARVVAHAAHQERVELQERVGGIGAARPRDRLAELRELRDDGVVRTLGQRPPDRALAEGQVLHRLRASEERVERLDGGGGETALAQLLDDAVLPDLVELVDRDERLLVLGGREAERLEHPDQQPPVVDAHERALEPQPVDRVERRDEQLGLGAHRRLPDDVDVALHELAVAALLRALGPPHRSDLDAAEHRRQFRAVARVEPRERHGQVEPQAEVDEVERLGGGLQVVVRQPALLDAEGELLVVTPEPRVQARTVLRDGRLDLVEAVGAIAVPDDREQPFAMRLLRRQEVAHSPGRIDGVRHPSSLSGRLAHRDRERVG